MLPVLAVQVVAVMVDQQQPDQLVLLTRVAAAVALVGRDQGQTFLAAQAVPVLSFLR